ncbi:transmembrane protein 116-like [Rhopilema esculentum]|uniref:transmembrane protein 116-like n=1 Tax=Rhopilema esculentum TaxID=499914 RepID=UPI0031CDBBF4
MAKDQRAGEIALQPTAPFLYPTKMIYVLSGSQMKSLSYLYLIMACMSLLGSASIVITSIVKRKMSNREVHPIFHLSLADLLGSLFLFIGSIAYHTLEETAIRNKSCPYLTGFATAFYMATFFLTLNYARTVYQKITVRAKGDSVRRPIRPSVDRSKKVGLKKCNTQFVYYGLAWSLPLLVTIILFSVDHTSFGPNDNICSSCLPLFHFKNSNCQMIKDASYKDEPDWYGIYKYTFLGFLVLSIIGTVAYNMMAYRAFRSIQIYGGIISKRQRGMLTSVKRRLALFCGTFLICWTPSLVLGIISMSSSFQMKSLYWLYIIQACTCPLQGFINAFIYGWYRPGFKQAINERSPLVVQPASSFQSDV